MDKKTKTGKTNSASAVMGIAPRFPPNSMIKNEVIFRCSNKNIPNLGPGEYSLPEHKLIKQSHNKRANSFSQQSSIDQFGSNLSNLVSINAANNNEPNIETGGTLFTHKNTKKSFHKKNNENQRTPPPALNSTDWERINLDIYRKYVAKAAKSTGGKRFEGRPQPIIDIRKNFGAPGSSFRTPNSDCLSYIVHPHYGGGGVKSFDDSYKKGNFSPSPVFSPSKKSQRPRSASATITGRRSNNRDDFNFINLDNENHSAKGLLATSHEDPYFISRSFDYNNSNEFVFDNEEEIL
jgi:hypothetical protein